MKYSNMIIDHVLEIAGLEKVLFAVSRWGMSKPFKA